MANQQTQGEWYNDSLEGKIRDGKQGIICELVKGTKTDQEAEANAELIAEVGTVTNETGYTPKQLAEQKDVLHRACLMAKEELVFGGNWDDAKRIIDEAIEKATE